MIDIQITGTLPQVNADFTEAMGQIGELMFDSVTQNFIAGGRPNQWTPLKTGEQAHLIKSGAMVETMQMQTDDRSATISLNSPYAWVHNFGTGNTPIKHPGSNKFQAFFYNGEMIYTWKTKPHDINIPARPFMMFQDEDKTKILERLSSAIFIEPQRRTQ